MSKTLLEEIEELTKSIPDSEWAKLPKDSSSLCDISIAVKEVQRCRQTIEKLFEIFKNHNCYGNGAKLHKRITKIFKQHYGLNHNL